MAVTLNKLGNSSKCLKFAILPRDLEGGKSITSLLCILWAARPTPLKLGQKDPPGLVDGRGNCSRSESPPGAHVFYSIPSAECPQ